MEYYLLIKLQEFSFPPLCFVMTSLGLVLDASSNAYIQIDSFVVSIYHMLCNAAPYLMDDVPCSSLRVVSIIRFPRGFRNDR